MWLSDSAHPWPVEELGVGPSTAKISVKNNMEADSTAHLPRHVLGETENLQSHVLWDVQSETRSKQACRLDGKAHPGP